MGNKNRVESVTARRLRVARRLSRELKGLVTLDHLEKAELRAWHRSALFKDGKLVEPFPGVYRFVEVGESSNLIARAACIWADGLVSFASAGRMRGWDGCDAEKNPPLDLIASRRVRSRDGVRVRVGDVAKSDREILHGVPITSARRTLWGLAEVLDDEDFAFAFESAWRLDHIDPRRWMAQLERVRGVPPALSRALTDATYRAVPMQSPLEVRTWRGMKRARLPTPMVQ